MQLKSHRGFKLRNLEELSRVLQASRWGIGWDVRKFPKEAAFKGTKDYMGSQPGPRVGEVCGGHQTQEASGWSSSGTGD